MARFAPRETAELDSRTMPAYIAFIRLVNSVAAGTFGIPETQKDTPAPGYHTEKYPTARVIHAPGDQGIRIVADTDEAAAAFREAARQLNIHISG